MSSSSTKAEYKVLLDSCKEALWLINVLDEPNIRPRDAIPIHADNEGKEALPRNPSHHSRTKHIHAIYNFIRDCVNNREFEPFHVSTKDMLADMLTKTLLQVMLERHRRMFGIFFFFFQLFFFFNPPVLL